jgi:pyridoxamine 5'-phosphate oxidase
VAGTWIFHCAEGPGSRRLLDGRREPVQDSAFVIRHSPRSLVIHHPTSGARLHVFHFHPRLPVLSPIDHFGELIAQAMHSEIPEPTAMALATVDGSGQPSVRMVLLKGFDERGFTFYTNLESRKARDLEERPVAALCFHWQPLEVQVRVEGPVLPVSEVEADEYFASRPRGSQIGAWASRQSQPLSSRDELEQRIRETEERFAEETIPRPEFWSGYRVVPERIEFWYGRASRLHERELFTRTGEAWTMERLYP